MDWNQAKCRSALFEGSVRERWLRLEARGQEMTAAACNLQSSSTADAEGHWPCLDLSTRFQKQSQNLVTQGSHSRVFPGVCCVLSASFEWLGKEKLASAFPTRLCCAVASQVTGKLPPRLQVDKTTTLPSSTLKLSQQEPSLQQTSTRTRGVFSTVSRDSNQDDDHRKL